MLYLRSSAAANRQPSAIAAVTGLIAGAILILSSSGCSAPATVSVPRVVGKQEASAKAELHRLGFQTKIIWQGHSSAVPPPPKSVLVQRPSAGQEAAAHSVVTLIVYL
jgi:beta-lactam-binding protein with PASTA domain